MDAMLREALRKYNGLRQHLDNVLLGEDGDVWEAEFKNFLAKRPCWVNRCVVVEQSKPELLLEPKWTVDENGVIRLTLPATTGRTGEEWIAYFEQKGDRPTNQAKYILCSSQFQPTTGIVNTIAILPGKLWQDSQRITKQIRHDAYAGIFTKGQKLADPQAEVACLIRDYLTDDEIATLGLWDIVDMREPIEDSDGSPSLLCANRFGDGRRLNAYCDDPALGWRRGSGFVFVASQVLAPQA